MSDTCRQELVAVALAALLSATGQGAVLRVPGDYASIQNAIDAGYDGDAILVRQGLYYENVNLKGKALTVTSTNPADLNVVLSTIIHASGQSLDVRLRGAKAFS